MDLSSRKIKKYIREGYDLNLISRIQSDIPDFKYDDKLTVIIRLLMFHMTDTQSTVYLTSG